MIPKILDILRILSVSVAFFFGYMIGFKDGFNPEAQLHFMIPIIIAAIAGLSGIEGLFFGKQSAEAKGYEVGSNYQRQSAIALLSYAVVAVFVSLSGWGIISELTIFFAFMFFLIFSGVNHAVDAIKNKNYKWQNINRPFITLLLLAGMIYPVIAALKNL
jgi:hypothetical protein